MSHYVLCALIIKRFKVINFIRSFLKTYVKCCQYVKYSELCHINGRGWRQKYGFHKGKYDLKLITGPSSNTLFIYSVETVSIGSKKRGVFGYPKQNATVSVGSVWKWRARSRCQFSWKRCRWTPYKYLDTDFRSGLSRKKWGSKEWQKEFERKSFGYTET
jgi:hypothetical protein